MNALETVINPPCRSSKDLLSSSRAKNDDNMVLNNVPSIAHKLYNERKRSRGSFSIRKKCYPQNPLFWMAFTLMIRRSFADDLAAIVNASQIASVPPQDPISKISEQNPSSQQWDVKLHDLEQKLEKDLEKVENDAKARVSSSAVDVGASFATAEIQSNLTLDQDLLRVKNDINDLLQSVQSVEEEMRRSKVKMENEEKVIQKKSAEMETEKILDGLHRGKLNLKVDYVTGQLVSSQKEKRRERRSAAFEEVRREKRSAAFEEIKVPTNQSTNFSSSTISITESEAIVANSIVESKEEDQLNGEDEKTLNEIVDAASAVLKPDASTNDDDKAISEQAIASENVIQQLEENPDLKIRVKEEIKSLRSDSDPAVLSMDFQLLLDVVKLAMTAALFGLTAVFMRLPPTAGFLMGGMLIGPSCFDWIGELHHVQTLAQFGVIFLLFEQGLLYSLTYSEAPLGGSTRPGERMSDADDCATIDEEGHAIVDSKLYSRKQRGRGVHQFDLVTSTNSSNLESDHDPNVVGGYVLVLLIFTAATIVWITEVVVSLPEAIIVSCAIAVCSTTIVSENLHAAKIADTQWGKGVLKMISMHDLFMVPLLALPELLSSVDYLKSEEGGSDETNFVILTIVNIMFQLGVASVFVRGAMILAKNIISAANLAETRMIGEKSELFTLSVVAYALLIATMSDQLKLSIEAGAVLAGVALMRSPHVPKVIASIAPITSVFGGMYLTSLGTILSPVFVLNHAGEIVELVFFIGLFKLALVATTLNRVFDYGITSSLAVGSAMAQVSEVSLLVLAKAQRIGLVSRKTYLLLIPTVFILLTMAPFSASHLRRLKMQEVTGTDDGKVPLYLCFLQFFNLLRHPKTRTNHAHFSASANEESNCNYLHKT